MDRHLAIAAAVLTIAAFVPAIFFFIRAATHFVKMWANTRSARHNGVLNLLPFLAPFASHAYTDEGNVHRRAFLSSFGAFLFWFAFIVGMFLLLGIPMQA
jgi:hypothetical protein